VPPLGAQHAWVQSITTHPNYDPFSKDNDIAILHLEQPFAIGGSVKIAPLASNDTIGAGTRCIATGWGITAANGRVPCPLQEGGMTLMTNAQADAKLASAGVSLNDAQSGFTDLQVSPQKGDQGGGMYCGGLLYGVNSFGIGDVDGFSTPNKYPYVTTKVYDYLPWITAMTY
jgi:secreted trypsin-like serine protease